MRRMWLFLGLCMAGRAWADVGAPPAMNAVTIEEHVGAELPAGITLLDAQGQPRSLDAIMDSKRPTLLVLGYYRCQMLCGLVLNGLVRSLRESALRVGRDVDVVAVSIAADEGPEDARLRASQVLGADATRAPGWNFLVGDAAGMQHLAEAVGFHYQYDASSRQYAHPALVTVVTPARRVSGYLYGFGPSVAELESAVRAAAAEHPAPVFERILMHCFRYTPALRRYAGSIALALKATGTLILVALGAIMLVARRREVRG